MSNITMKKIGDEMHFSCGCKATTIGGNFMITPCDVTCEVLRYVYAKSVAQGNDISLKIDEDNR